MTDLFASSLAAASRLLASSCFFFWAWWLSRALSWFKAMAMSVWRGYSFTIYLYRLPAYLTETRQARLLCCWRMWLWSNVPYGVYGWILLMFIKVPELISSDSTEREHDPSSRQTIAHPDVVSMAGVLSSLKQGFFDHTRKVSPNLFVCPGGWQISCQRDSGSLPKPARTFIWLWPRLCILHRFEYFPGFAGRSVLLFGWSEKLLPGYRIENLIKTILIIYLSWV